jgi:CheY-like chemotaxis protein/DNA-binding Xre family transcriptional regulator
MLNQSLEDIVAKSIGKKIADLRKSRGLSQDELSEQLRISRQLLQKYETGEARMAIITLYNISILLNENIKYFVDSTPSSITPDQIFDGLIPLRRTKPLKILIVEDKLSDIEMTKRAIDSSGFEINMTSAVDGVEALNLLRSKDIYGDNFLPDIIFLDLNIPKKDGVMVLKEIKGDRDLYKIQVIILTNSNNIEEMERLYALGASGYVVKSFYPDEYCEKIGLVIGYWYNMALPNM